MGALEIVVADTGIGIAPADQARVFEEFQQVDNSATRQHQGTGLGLALARRLVELQGGRLWLESAPGEGSRFGFTVPLPAAAVGQARPDTPALDHSADGPAPPAGGPDSVPRLATVSEVEHAGAATS